MIFVGDKVFLRHREDAVDASQSEEIVPHTRVRTKRWKNSNEQQTAATKPHKIVVGLDLIDSGVAPSAPYDLTTSIQRTNSVSKETQVLVHQTLSKLDSWVQLPELLEKLNFKTGAELGVLKGEGARALLDTWPGAEKYFCVDLWQHQENYLDSNNWNNEGHNENYAQAQEALKDYKDKTVFMRMLTTEAAKLIADQSLDYIYVDARHDYCGVTEDIKAWYPKLKLGGIMAGHDYLTNAELKKLDPDQDWGLCQDGRRNEGAVKKAVNDFAEKHKLVVYSTTKDSGYETWIYGIKLKEISSL